MKKITSLKIVGAVLATAFAALAARADLAINENVSLSGYAAGSFSYSKTQGAGTDLAGDLDAAKIGVDLNFAPITAKVSLYTDNGTVNGDRKLYALDVYATYSFNERLSVTGGRFLTWLGYEEFDIPETNFITWGSEWGSSDFFLGATTFIPDYHEGFKVDYKNGKAQLGLAVLDSIYGNGVDLYRGDGSVRDGIGLEGHFEYTEENWALGMTFGYQEGKEGYHTIDPYVGDPRMFLANIWLERTFDDITVAGELLLQRMDGKAAVDTKNNLYAMISVKQQLDEKLALAGRLSYGDQEDFGHFWKLSVVPASYELTKNLAVRGEVSYTRYSKGIRDISGPKYELFAGVQAVLKF